MIHCWHSLEYVNRWTDDGHNAQCCLCKMKRYIAASEIEKIFHSITGHSIKDPKILLTIIESVNEECIV